MQKFTGKEYLQISIANSFGLDKCTWDQRLDWFKTNENQLDQLIQHAEDPAMFYAGIQAWRAVQRGEPIGFPISLDATSSGLQILAALTGDRKAAQLCNVVDTGKREDAYTIIFDRMVNYLTSLGAAAGGISREDCKQAIMTSLYGSQAEPKKVFGEGMQLRVFYKMMIDAAPAAWDLNETFLEIWNSEALSHDWVLPDNFHVHVKVMKQVKETIHFMNQPHDVYYKVNEPTEEGRSLGANTIHSLDGMIVREITRRCDYDPNVVLKVTEALLFAGSGTSSDRPDDLMLIELWNHYVDTGYLSARILDYIDDKNVGLITPGPIWELIKSLPDKPFKVISVHDCFRVLPNYGNDLRWQYNNQLMLIAKSNILQNLLSQIVGRELVIGKLDENMWKDVINTNYALS